MRKRENGNFYEILEAYPIYEVLLTKKLRNFFSIGGEKCEIQTDFCATSWTERQKKDRKKEEKERKEDKKERKKEKKERMKQS